MCGARGEGEEKAFIFAWSGETPMGLFAYVDSQGFNIHVPSFDGED